MNDTVVYKVISASDWEAFSGGGAFAGSAVDLRDGYIHLSTRAQLRETLARHYAGREDLRLLPVSVAALPAGALRWEPSRGGALFPHLYAPLDLGAVGEVSRLDVLPDGTSTLSGDFP